MESSGGWGSDPSMDKNKIIEAVGKLVAKGAYDKAIKEYEKILEVDSKDIRIIQKVGELYQKSNQPAKAAEYYAKVAESYASDGFFQKAVSLYKQVLKLNPDMVEVNLRLAELHEQLLLLSEAMAYYQLVVGHHEKRGDTRAALALLAKMVELDPESVSLRVKLADLYGQEGMPAEAVAELGKAAAQLRSQNRLDDYLRVLERLAELEPESLQRMRELVESYLARGDHKRALTKLQQYYQRSPKEPEVLRLLANAFLGLGQIEKTVAVFKQLARTYVDTGRAEEADRIWQQVAQLAPKDSDVLARGMVATASKTGTSWKVAPSLDTEARNAQPTSALGPEQARKLLTETDVYLKYGLHDKALEHLGKIFSVDPENLDAHEKAYQIYVAANNSEQAFEQLLNVLRLCTRRPDVERAQPYLDALLSSQPHHPEVQVFLSVLRGGDAEGVAENGEVAPPLDEEAILVEASDEQLILEEPPGGDAIDEGELPRSAPVDLDPVDEPSLTVAEGRQPYQEECDEAAFLLEQGLWEEASELVQSVLLAFPEHERARKLQAQLASASPSTPRSSPETVAFDEVTRVDLPRNAEEFQYSAQEVLSEFKRGLQREVKAEDVNTHYDLGIAYKEMGLYDDAIEEFERARVGVAGQARELDCLTLIGILQVARGNLPLGMEAFRTVLRSPLALPETLKGVRYELAGALEASGEPGRALFHYQKVVDVDPSYREARERAWRLSERVSPVDDDEGLFEKSDSGYSKSESQRHVGLNSRRVGYV